MYTDDIYRKCKSSVVSRPSVIPDFLLSQKTEICSVKLSGRLDREQIYDWNKIAHETAQGYKNIHFINLEDVFCPGGTCSMIDAHGTMLYRDLGHLNTKGSIYAAPFIFGQLRK